MYFKTNLRVIVAIVISINVISINVISINIALGQPINHLMQDVEMPSHEAASLGKYGDIPVGHSTGVPGIGIDLGNIKESSLSVDVRLNYHASGVKVSEVASRVGLGWSIQAGGMISRTILGVSDDATYGWLNGIGSGVAFSNPRDAFMHLDYEPDIFQLNLPGYSCKFIFDYGIGNDETVEAILMPKQDIKITKKSSGNLLDGFEVVLPSGVKCYFGTHGVNEAVERHSRNGYVGGVIQGWYLLRMETPDGNHSIDFEYLDEKYYQKSPASAEFYSEGYSCALGSTFSSGSRFINNENLPYNEQYISGKVLSRIVNSSNTSSVEFIRDIDNPRLDIEDKDGFFSYPLLAVKFLEGTVRNKKFTFSYDYFDRESNDGFPESTDSYQKRLKLQSLQESTGDGSGVPFPPYVFQYFGTENDLPVIFSHAIDHWGYYNGWEQNNNNMVNVPRTSLLGV